MSKETNSMETFADVFEFNAVLFYLSHLLLLVNENYTLCDNPETCK